VCFINPAFMHRKLRVLPWEISRVPWSVACEANWLREEKSFLTAREKSAEGIVGDGRPTAGTGNEPRDSGMVHPTEGLNGSERD
jgi:hypothetical protein